MTVESWHLWMPKQKMWRLGVWSWYFSKIDFEISQISGAENFPRSDAENGGGQKVRKSTKMGMMKPLGLHEMTIDKVK